MKLPNAKEAEIDRNKITEYLLSLSHPYGRSKALFFTSFGFQIKIWLELSTALKQHAIQNLCSSVQKTKYGKKFIIDGSIQAPDGREPTIKSVWFIKQGESTPRFVTAYPLKGDNNDK